jgi:hypothetical protein
VEHGPVLGDINLLAPEHRVNAFLQAGLLRKLDEESHGVVCNPILRIVKEQAGGFNGHTSTAPRILGEEGSKMHLAGILIMGLEGFPGLTPW